jgi:hypothetical protein
MKPACIMFSSKNISRFFVSGLLCFMESSLRRTLVLQCAIQQTAGFTNCVYLFQCKSNVSVA